MEQLALATVHRAMGADWTQALGYDLPRSFGDVAQEQGAVEKSVGLVDESYRGVLDLVGDGIAEALEKVVSSTVSELRPGVTFRGQPSCLLSAKGRLLGAFHLFALADGAFRLVFREPLSEAVRAQLERYMFLADIEVVPRPEVAVLSVQGPAATSVVGEWQPALELPTREWEAVMGNGDVVIVRGGQTGAGGFELWVAKAALESIWRQLGELVARHGGCAVGHEAAEVLRVEAGIARHGKEYDAESFPNEVGWESALKYDKCYVGQEVVARMRTYGQVHRQLRGLLAEGAIPPPEGAAVQVGEQEVGRVTSSAYSERLECSIALALIKRKAWRAESATVCSDDGEQAVRIVELPFGSGEKREDVS